jgi:hypothetical protein
MQVRFDQQIIGFVYLVTYFVGFALCAVFCVFPPETNGGLVLPNS